MFESFEGRYQVGHKRSGESWFAILHASLKIIKKVFIGRTCGKGQINFKG